MLTTYFIHTESHWKTKGEPLLLINDVIDILMSYENESKRDGWLFQQTLLVVHHFDICILIYFRWIYRDALQCCKSQIVARVKLQCCNKLSLIVNEIGYISID